MKSNEEMFGSLEVRELTDRVLELERAIATHRSQKADDRCIEDDDQLYAVLKDGIKCDRRVGSKEEMLHNCKRFIEKRCEGGGWQTYEEMKNELDIARTKHLATVEELRSVEIVRDVYATECSRLLGELQRWFDMHPPGLCSAHQRLDLNCRLCNPKMWELEQALDALKCWTVFPEGHVMKYHCVDCAMIGSRAIETTNKILGLASAS